MGQVAHLATVPLHFWFLFIFTMRLFLNRLLLLFLFLRRLLLLFFFLRRLIFLFLFFSGFTFSSSSLSSLSVASSQSSPSSGGYWNFQLIPNRIISFASAKARTLSTIEGKQIQGASRPQPMHTSRPGQQLLSLIRSHPPFDRTQEKVLHRLL